MSIDALVQALEENPDLDASTETLLPFVDGPEFFEGWLKAQGNTKVGKYKGRLYKSEPGLLTVIGKRKESFKLFLQWRYHSLGEIGTDVPLAVALVSEGPSVNQIAKALIEHDLFSPVLPDDLLQNRVRAIEHYFDPNIVGNEALTNLKRFVQKNYPTLIDIKVGDGVTKYLGVKKENKFSINKVARKFIEYGFLNPELPDSLLGLSFKKIQIYFNPEVVGDEVARENLTKKIRSQFSTLDDIVVPYTRSVGRALGIKTRKGWKVCKKLVELGVFSPELPDGHPISRPAMMISYYINPHVVGREEVVKNLKKYVQCTYTCVEDIGKDHPLGVGLVIRPCERYKPVNEIRNRVLELGWLDSSEFRPYAESCLPPEFRPIVKREKRLRPIGATARRKDPNTTTFPKGEAFEQLIGLFLAYTRPDELIIPQYCLDVGVKRDRGYFRTRADYKVGNDIYEVKWGLAEEDIGKTTRKHRQLLRRPQNQSLQYHLVKLEDGKASRIPCEMYQTLLETSVKDAEVKSWFESIAVLLMETAEQSTDAKSIDFLRHFRDFFYNVIDQANQKKGTERQQYIGGVLADFCRLADSQAELDRHMQDNTPRSYASLEAHFEYNGVLYRGFVNPPQLQQESPRKYETIYYFGDTEFTEELDRNIAVVLECSPAVKRIDRGGVIKYPMRIQRHPVFNLSNSTRISTNENTNTIKITSLDQLKDITGISEERYRFALQYIEECGLRC